MSGKVVDLEEIIKDFAWDAFVKTRRKQYKDLEFQDVSFDIVWDRVSFISEKPEFEDPKTLELPNAKVVFKSIYENRTDQTQEHTFQTERSTVSCATTAITKGYTKGVHVDLKLGLPNEVAGIAVGFGREVKVDKTDENTVEESITWTINSSIKVPKNHRTVAELVVKEQRYNAKFKVNTKIRGLVVVMIRNPRDHNSLVQVIEQKITEIMMSNFVPEKYRSSFQIDKKSVKWEVAGSCEFQYGIEQHVQLSESPL